MNKAFFRSLLAAILVAISAGSDSAYRADASLDPEIVLYRFQGIGSGDGMSPTRTLMADEDGALFGTTAFGGEGTGQGDGTVFKLVHHGVGHFLENVLYRFRGLNNGDGMQAEATLVADATGALYGTTVYGGSAAVGGGGGGIVFKLTPTTFDRTRYSETVIYRFKGGNHNDGSQPYAGVIIDGSGALYGTTAFGGSGYGTVFKLSPDRSGYRETVIYRFNGIAAGDGANPYSLLIADGTGALYGTTANGGSTSFAAQGGGVVFKLTPAGHGYTESVLYRFQGGTYNDGATPVAGLMFDQMGDLFGTTELGGSLAAGDRGQGGGAVFELTPTQTGYAESIPYEFQGPANGDGYFPQCALIADRNGNLYGTTSFGGSDSDGIVFKLSQSMGNYSESILYTFVGAPGNDGAQPYSSLIAGRFGSMSGTTLNGGSGDGTVFRITP
jgi:uncharacterized repeat protein (TIGR03803 family)